MTPEDAAQGFQAWLSQYRLDIAPRPLGWWDTGDLAAAYRAGAAAIMTAIVADLQAAGSWDHDH